MTVSNIRLTTFPFFDSDETGTPCNKSLSRVTQAVFIAVCGWPVIPCATEADDSKRVYATTNPQKIIDWWFENPDCLFGILGRIDDRGEQRTPRGIRLACASKHPSFNERFFLNRLFLIPPKNGWQRPVGTSDIDTGDLFGKYKGYRGEW